MARKQWVGDYYDAKGRRIRRAFATKMEADQWEAEGRAKAAADRAAAASKMLRRVTKASATGGR